MAREDSNCIVGYGKPPKHAQFKPGQSGNPRGRPKKSTTFDDDINAELRSSVTIVEGGEPRRITKRRAIAKQHVNKALKGDVRSTELLLKIKERLDPNQHDNLASLLDEFREKNRRIMANRATKKEAPTPKEE